LIGAAETVPATNSIARVNATLRFTLLIINFINKASTAIYMIKKIYSNIHANLK